MLLLPTIVPTKRSGFVVVPDVNGTLEVTGEVRKPMAMTYAVSISPQNPHWRFLVMEWPFGDSIIGHLHGSYKLGTSSLRHSVLERRYQPWRAQAEKVSDEYVITGSSTRTQLDLLQQLTSNSSLDTVEVRNGSEGFLIKMRDGHLIRCVHNDPHGGSLPDYAPHPAIVLKMEDGSDLFLPIIISEMPSVLLMAAVRNVEIARPILYQILKEMMSKMGYEVKLVRVTKRVHEASFAQLYLAKVGDDAEMFCFDLRPSDAINIAVRCQVPIQVNKQLAYSDGMRVVEPKKIAVDASVSDGLLVTELDRPDGQRCIEAAEFELICNMLIAAGEERYGDAAQWRDKLTQLRTKRKNQAS